MRMSPLAILAAIPPQLPSKRIIVDVGVRRVAGVVAVFERPNLPSAEVCAEGVPNQSGPILLGSTRGSVRRLQQLLVRDDFDRLLWTGEIVTPRFAKAHRLS